MQWTRIIRLLVLEVLSAGYTRGSTPPLSVDSFAGKDFRRKGVAIQLRLAWSMRRKNAGGVVWLFRWNGLLIPRVFFWIDEWWYNGNMDRNWATRMGFSRWRRLVLSLPISFDSREKVWRCGSTFPRVPEPLCCGVEIPASGWLQYG